MTGKVENLKVFYPQSDIKELCGFSTRTALRYEKIGKMPRRRVWGGIKGWLAKDVIDHANGLPVVGG